MPFTPLHFGPAAALAFSLKKYIDWPVFLLVNVAIDIEPLLVLLFRFNYPLHGYCHTFLFGSLIGFLTGLIAYRSRNAVCKLMLILHLKYQADLKKMVVSGILGVWLHIFLDSFIYSDIRPFYPIKINPLYSWISLPVVYAICGVFFIPAIILYVINKNNN